jgi:glycerate kinase
VPAVDVTAAIADSWRARQPAAEVVALPFSSGGHGFVRSLSVSLPGVTDEVWRLRDGSTDYLDGALLTADGDSAQLGRAIGASIAGGARRIVVGVGDAAGVDGGAGLIAALGDSDDLEIALPRAVERTREVELVAAYREDIPLLGLKGASASAVESLGWTRHHAQDNERRVGDFAEAVRRVLPPPRDLLSGQLRRVDRAEGSGAGGGAGFALATLGARLVPGAEVFADAVGLPRQVAQSDLIVVATRIFDWRSLAADTVATVTHAAADAARASVVLAEEAEVGRRETMSLGASAAYSIIDPHSLRRREHADTLTALSALARRVAGTWSSV